NVAVDVTLPQTMPDASSPPTPSSNQALVGLVGFTPPGRYHAHPPASRTLFSSGPESVEDDHASRLPVGGLADGEVRLAIAVGVDDQPGPRISAPRRRYATRSFHARRRSVRRDHRDIDGAGQLGYRRPADDVDGEARLALTGQHEIRIPIVADE